MTTVAAGCGGRLGRMNAGLAGAVLAVCGRLVVGGDGGAGDDLAGGMAEVLAS